MLPPALRLLAYVAIVLLKATVFSVVVLAVTKSTFGWPADSSQENVWLLACVFAAATLWILLLDYRKFRRRASIRKLAERLSFSFAADGSEEAAEQLGKRLRGRTGKLLGNNKRTFALRDVLQGDRDGVRILVGDLETRIEYDEGADDVVKRTVVFFTGPHLGFPQFALQPGRPQEKGVGRFLGKEDAGANDRATFAEAYRLSSSEAEAAQRLFDEELQEHLARHPGWEIRSEHESILFARSVQEPAGAWEGLLDESSQILSLLIQSFAR
ncbi:MAG TPA: hypothetical protein DDW52_04685 [Planctomycetaceae bacterium]|nr:hypothetical protein [Planctomycetaceae bacterium]